MADRTRRMTQSVTAQGWILSASHELFVKLAMASFPHKFVSFAQNHSLFVSKGVIR